MTEDALPTIGVWSYGLAAVGFGVFAIRLGLGWRPGVRAALLLGATVVTAAWAVAGVLVVLQPGYLVWFASTATDALRYAVWFLFLGHLLRGQRDGRSLTEAAGIPGWLIVLVGVGLAACLIIPEGPPFAAVPDAVGRLPAFAVRLGLATFGLILVEQMLRRADQKSRWAIRPLCVGLAGVFIFDLYYFADAMLYGRLDAVIWVARGAANAIVIPFIALATARNPGWTIEMHVSRGAVFHSTAIVVVGLFLLAVAGAGYIVRYIGGDWGRAIQIELFFAALMFGLLAVTSGSFRSKLRVFVSKHFFSYRYDYREEWLRFTRTISAQTRMADVEEQCVRALADLVESTGGALWLRSDEGSFRPASRWNMPASDAIEPAAGGLAEFLERTGWVIDLPEVTQEPDRYEGLKLPDWLLQMPTAWLVVPLTVAAELVGFAVLARPRAAVQVNWEVRDLLKVASSQAASYLGQVRATEALVESRKFDAFNRMSAFVVHDLKNLVAQLSLMLRNAERHRDNPRFQKDMLSTVEHVVGRMNQLMLQLRTGAMPVEKPRLVDLEPLVRRVCSAREGAESRIDLDLAQGVRALGHPDRLDHVIGHLVQNALDATAAGGRVGVRLLREGAQAVVEVKDSGVGMSAEFMRERLFRPFETSKASGMGIGVYESVQYVSSLGGKLLYESAPGEGTCVRVLLSLGDPGLAVAPAEAAA